MYTRRALLIVATGLLTALAAFSSQAQQTFPSRTITIVVGNSPGGPFDLISRLYAAQLDRKWKQTVVVENRVGAGGALALAAVAKAPPDGHTIAMASGWIVDVFVKDLPLSTQDIVPLSLVGVAPYAIVTGKNLQARTLAEFVAFAKANPGKLNWGIVPTTLHEIETSETLAALGIQANIIGYKGIAPINTALVSGELDVALGNGSPQLRTGQIRGIAVGGQKRFSELPDVATFREQGVAYDPAANYPFWIRVGTPRDISGRLAAEVAEMVRSPEFLERIQKPFAILGTGFGPDESMKILRSDYERARRAAARLNITPQ